MTHLNAQYANKSSHWFPYVPFLATVLVLWLLYSIDDRPEDFELERQIACGLSLIACIPMFLHLKMQKEYAPLFAANCLFFISAYATGPFFTNNDARFACTAEETRFALFVCLIGLVSQMTGYYWTRNTRIVCPETMRFPEVSHGLLGWIGWSMAAIAFLPVVVPALLRIPTVGHITTLFEISSIAILTARVLSAPVRNAEKVAFGVLFFGLVSAGLLSGSFANAMRLGLVIAVVSFASRRYSLSGLVVVMSMGLLFVVNPVKDQYRQEFWREKNSASSFERADKLVNLIADHWLGYAVKTREAGNMATLDRVSRFYLLTKVTELTPDEVPYWGGQTFLELGFAMIPRIVWPDKPESTVGNQFGHRYRILHGSDATTSVNLPWLVEFYANFGVIGTAIGFFGIGAMFRILEKWFLDKPSRDYSRVLSLGLLSPLAFPESNFALMFGSLFLGILLLRLFIVLTQSLKVKLSREREHVSRRLCVLQYQRKKRKDGNYSLESVFEDIRTRLQNKIDIEFRLAPYLSNGFFSRLFIVVDAWLSQKQINHLTGDINFAVFGFKRQTALITILDCGFLTRTTGVKRKILKTLWLDWPVRHAAKVVTISEAARREIVDLTKCNPEKVSVIPVAISELFAPVPYVFSTSPTRILLVGTAPNKNLSRVIDACCGIDCTLVIIGKLPEEIHQQLLARNQPFENHLNLTRSEVFEQYSKCDMLCFASTYEGFGMPILEAQAVGRPVVTSRISSMPEVAGNAACFVDPYDIESIGDGIRNVISSADLRDKLVGDGFENASRFQPDQIANQYLELYRTLAMQL